MPRGEDILKAFQALYNDTRMPQLDAQKLAADQAAAEGELRRARDLRRFKVHCDTSVDHDRGRFGEIIKPVTEAAIVASEINPMPKPEPLR